MFKKYAVPALFIKYWSMAWKNKQFLTIINNSRIVEDYTMV